MIARKSVSINHRRQKSWFNHCDNENKKKMLNEEIQKTMEMYMTLGSLLQIFTYVFFFNGGKEGVNQYCFF
jgi:hypothetical protein